jgi:signal transduction histidine kinase
LVPARLLSERETSELREQFIAVLGHGLRNPLPSIVAGARMLTKEHQDIERNSRIDAQERGAVGGDGGRIAQLFSNLLGNAVNNSNCRSPMRANRSHGGRIDVTSSPARCTFWMRLQ